MSFTRPWLLLLLPAAVAILVLVLFRLPIRERKKRVFAAVVRTVLIALVVLALAGARREQKTEGRAVAFLVDVSRSIPEASRAALSRWIETARAARRPEDADEVILFGAGAGIEAPFPARPGGPSAPFDLDRPRSRVDPDATDIAGAIRLAVSSFPEGFARRIVLVTDGNENRGDAIAAARRAAGDGTDILALPVRYELRSEVSVVRVDAPLRIAPGSVLTFTPILSSTDPDRHVLLRAFVDGRELDRRDVVLPKGKSRGPDFRVLLDEPRVHTLAVVAEAKGDGIPENNEARAAVTVEGHGGVLVVAGGAGKSEILDLLKSQGLATVRRAPGELYPDPYEYQAVDTVVLSDVSALDLTTPQMQALEVAVRDLGVGLVALGGDQAFGPGGYGDTPLERCLPVRMEIREKQVMLNGALVLILHTCEFANGNYWATRIARESIAALTPSDYAGIVIFDVSGTNWALPLQHVTNPATIFKQIDGMEPQDMPSFDDAFRLAEEDLAKCPSYLRHIVVISDGDAAPPDGKLIQQLVDEHITVSAVCIAPHGPSDEANMKDVARWGKGRYYLLKPGQVHHLPRIFVREAMTLRRSSIRRETFTPKWTMAPDDLPPALRGFGGELPSLDAFSLTQAKERAEVPIVTPDLDPVLAIWRYGLGKTAAFTSALKGGWIGAWASWPQTDRFFAQLVRSTFREAGRSGFRAEAEVHGGVATFRIQALTDTGEELDFLRFTAVATRPGEAPRPVPVEAKGAGTYEGSFPVTGGGSWLVVARYENPAGGPVQQLTIPVVVSYPEEYGDLRDDPAFFARLVDAAGARTIEPDTDVFAGRTEEIRAERPLGPLLLILAAILLVFDVFVRRVGIDPGPLLARLRPREKTKAAPKQKPPVRAAPVPDAPPAEKAPEPEDASAGPETPSPPDAAADRMKGLMEAKKRARRKRRWEDTGREKGADDE